MQRRGSIVLAAWVPTAAALGPIVGLRHGLPELIGGAIAISVPFGVAGLWQHLTDQTPGRRPSPRPGRSLWVAGIGFVLGLALMLSSYGYVGWLYAQVFADPREVVVVAVHCKQAKTGCMYYGDLSTPDGQPLAQALYDGVSPDTAGHTLTVWWDRLGYASPLPLTDPAGSPAYPGDRPLVPAPVWAALAALFATGTAFLVWRTRSRPAAGGRVSRRQTPRGRTSGRQSVPLPDHQ